MGVIQGLVKPLRCTEAVDMRRSMCTLMLLYKKSIDLVEYFLALLLRRRALQSL